MDFAKLSSDLNELRRRNRGLGLTVAGLLLALLVCLVILLNVIGSERTIVVPPSIDKTFWVTKERISREYLEQMGSFIAWLILDVSPASIDWKRGILLNYVAPEQYGAIKTRQEIEAERLKRINAATAFSPQQLVPGTEATTLLIRGRLRTLVNGQETANEQKSYRAEFRYAGGRIHLQSFQEISP
jgi:conjugal transfer pilus assembly protein TraE